MTYEIQEESVYGGAPIELYEFNSDGLASWRYTSSDEDVVYLANTYEAISIKRNNIEQSQDVARASLTVSMPSSTDFIQQFVTEPPFVRISLVMRRFHETDASDEIISIWVGRVINVEQKESVAEVRCESSYSSLKRPTLRRLYQVNCSHLLYGPICGVLSASYQTSAVLTGVSGLDITSTSYSAAGSGYFTGGYVEYITDGETIRRFITNHVTDTITLNLPLYTVSIGDTVLTYPGCSHTTSDCISKFNNILNYGGQPWIPDINPMGGSPIF